MKGMSAALTLLFALAACDAMEKPRTAATVQNIVFDEELIEAAKRIPGFGGLYVDEDVVKVYLTEDVRRWSAKSRRSRQRQVEAALTDVFDETLLRPDARTARQQNIPARQREIVFLKGEYDIHQLSGWRPDIDRLLAIPGVISTDLDERTNRLSIGVTDAASHERVEVALKNGRVPRDAVIVEVSAPVEPLATLESRHRPMPGGVVVRATTGWLSSNICTAGFNARRGNVDGFVVASHCTEVQGGGEDTDFHQPEQSGGSDNKVGDEIDDPRYRPVDYGCPSGQRCRLSDSAFIGHDGARGTGIARPINRNDRSLTINDANPRFSVVEELPAKAWVIGLQIDKVGRTTGWTTGKVSGTCRNINFKGTNITMLCQQTVSRISGHIHRMVDHGDSGSPAFRWYGATEVALAGIVWGGDETHFSVSPIHLIEKELGELTTFNFPAPQTVPTGHEIPLKICPSNRKCCGDVDAEGRCDGQCWPKENPCP